MPKMVVDVVVGKLCVVVDICLTKFGGGGYPRTNYHY
jgi:hypothetical protein